jgi:membrane-bound lytic murein transglycosylase B
MRFNFFFFKLFLSIFLLGGLFAPSSLNVEAQSAEQVAQQEAKLQAEYNALQKEIDTWQRVLDETRQKANTIQGDITILTAKIKEAELMIRQKNLAISKLGAQIADKSKKIKTLEVKLDDGRRSLAQIIRKTNEIDSKTLAEVFFAEESVSEFFQDIDSYDSIKSQMKEHFTVVREVKATTEEERQKLDQQKNEEADARYVVEVKKKTIAQTESEKKKLLAVTKTEASGYQAVLSERQKRAAQIRAALFKLRDTEGIPFAKALEYANFAGGKTGIRPALILAILTQESDLGKNQGSCILSSIDTGDGVGKNTGTFFEKVMKSPRDTEPFKDITNRLGLDWKITPVSCPPKAIWSSSRGYGGGMGPSQFIPSTWEIFKKRIASAVGVSQNEANPWNPEHSFTATAIYLSDLGAVSGSYSAERNAACRYYSGRKCDNQKPVNSFYGTQVLQKAEDIQANIDFLKGV